LQDITHVHIVEVLGMCDWKWHRAETLFRVEAEGLTEVIVWPPLI